eukprot:TRINITY_DN55050_c0_g1_i1.p1 TRINITY_DN55050_c0_g1~~TRINITY_DN55050_c0_g1_i1.p1  ORF type:complete len:323 (-),score=71.94 TRINITY_DN55050_c0_g1_i1:75-1043(-)
MAAQFLAGLSEPGSTQCPLSSDDLCTSPNMVYARAAWVLEDMKQKGLKPDVASYNAFISACGKAKRTDLAFNAFHEMKQRGLEPDLTTYNRVIRACKVTKQALQAVELLKEMRRRNVEPDISTYRAVSKVCMDCDMASKAWEVFEEMLCAGLCPNEITASDLSKAHVGMREEHVRPVLEISAPPGLELPATSPGHVYDSYDSNNWGYSQAYNWWTPNAILNPVDGAHGLKEYAMAWHAGTFGGEQWSMYQNSAWSMGEKLQDDAYERESTAPSSNGKQDEDGSGSASENTTEGPGRFTYKVPDEMTRGPAKLRQSRNKIPSA